MSQTSVQRPLTKATIREDSFSSPKTLSSERVVRSYVSQKAIKQGYKSCPIKTVSSAFIDDLVRGMVVGHL